MDTEREPVSAFIVAFNEEDQIVDCIRSLSFCDEVIVVDSFSKDRTVELSESAGARVIQREWEGYAAQKAFALQQIQHEWTINLDADERIAPELQKSIEEVLRAEYQLKISGKTESDPIVGYYMNRVVFYLGRWWRRGGWYPEWRMRFFKKSQVTWGGVEPHEKPITSGRTAKLQGEIEHYTYDNMDEQFERLHRYSGIAAREDFLRGKKVTILSLCLNPIIRTFKFYILKKGYREGTAGLIVSIAEGYYTFMKYAKLWEREHGSGGVSVKGPADVRSETDRTGEKTDERSQQRTSGVG